MQKVLFLLCPTDCLESIINEAFHYENYFYTSLGNCFKPESCTIKSIKEFITKHRIKHIYFVLSNDNQIVLDALGRQSFSQINGLKIFQNDITRLKKHSTSFWQSNNDAFSVLSYFLNHKKATLLRDLGGSLNHDINIHGKIYNRQDNTFKTIHSHLVCLESYRLN